MSHKKNSCFSRLCGLPIYVACVAFSSPSDNLITGTFKSGCIGFKSMVLQDNFIVIERFVEFGILEREGGHHWIEMEKEHARR